jgi:hypothetical protein
MSATNDIAMRNILNLNPQLTSGLEMNTPTAMHVLFAMNKVMKITMNQFANVP